MRTAIVVPVFNALPYVSRCLAQIRDLVSHPYLVVVDDASNPETHQYLDQYVGEMRREGRTAILLTNARQQLFTRAANRGIRYAYHHAKASAVAVVNSDCDLQPGWLEHLERALEDPRVGIAGYPDRSPDGELWRAEPYRPVQEPDYVTGHCILLRMQMLEEIGVFCETDTDGRDSPELAHVLGQAHIGSDRILCWRANRAGWKTLYSNYPGVYHEAGKSWGHRQDWLAQFRLEPLWPACDSLKEPLLAGEREVGGWDD